MASDKQAKLTALRAEKARISKLASSANVQQTAFRAHAEQYRPSPNEGGYGTTNSSHLGEQFRQNYYAVHWGHALRALNRRKAKLVRRLYRLQKKQPSAKSRPNQKHVVVEVDLNLGG